MLDPPVGLGLDADRVISAPLLFFSWTLKASSIPILEKEVLAPKIRSLPWAESIPASDPRWILQKMPGGQTQLFVRGLASDRTLTLLNGWPLQDLSSPSASVNWSLLPSQLSAHWEPPSQAVVNGSQALGGTLSLHSVWNSRWSVQRRQSIASAQGAWNAEARLQDKGLSAGSWSLEAETETLAHNPAPQGSEWDESRDFRFRLQHLQQRSEARTFFELFQQKSAQDFDEWSLSGGVDAPGLWQKSELTGAQGQWTRGPHFLQFGGQSFLRKDSSGFMELAEQKLLRYQRRGIDSIVGLDGDWRTEQQIWSGFWQVQKSFRWTRLNFGLRGEWVQAGGQKKLHPVAGFRLDHFLQTPGEASLFVDAAQGDRQPTSYQLFSTYGNPSLGPEQLSQISLGALSRLPRWGALQLEIFHLQLLEAIDFDLVFEKYRNRARIRSRGLVLGLQQEFSSGWASPGSLVSSLVWQEVRDEHEDFLPRRPQLYLQSSFEKSNQIWSWGGSLRLSGEMPDVDRSKLAPQALLGAWIARQFSRVQGRLSLEDTALPNRASFFGFAPFETQIVVRISSAF